MPSILQQRKLRLAAFAAKAATGTTPAADGPLAITGIRTYPLREPVSGRTYTVIKVETSSGLVGYGETMGIPPADLRKAGEAIRSRQATEIEPLRARLHSMPRVRAAVNMALLDIVGKFTKAPVYHLLGGPTRHKARALLRLEGTTDEMLVASCQRAREAGFRAFIVPIPPPERRSQGRALADEMRQRLEALRAVTGEEMDFVLDGAGSLAPADGASLSAALERFHLLWLDQPCPASKLGAMRKLAGRSVTPLGFGSQLDRPGAFQDLLREDAIDILRPDLALTGISEIRRIAAIAETYYVAVAPRHEGGPVATAAALHLAASIPNFYIQQIPWPEAEEDRRMRVEIAGPGVETVEDGFARLLTGPGLGTTVNEAALEKYRELRTAKGRAFEPAKTAGARHPEEAAAKASQEVAE
jgi:galactonate dehydratase